MCLRRSSQVVNVPGRGPVTFAEKCGLCWQCREARKRDLVARALAEMHFADGYFVTLTYRDCDERDADMAHRVVTKSHFQAFMKRLRREGWRGRYLVAAEIGPSKGRVHFHAILFQDRASPVRITKALIEERWGMGFVDVRRADARNVRYVVKYVLKDASSASGEKVTWVSWSKKPVLGFSFLHDMARRHEAKGLPPSLTFLVPGHRQRTRLTGVWAREYLISFAKARGVYPFITRLADVQSAEGVSATGVDFLLLACEKVEKYLAEKDADSDLQEYAFRRRIHLAEVEHMRRLAAKSKGSDNDE